MNKNIIQRAFLNATGVILYVMGLTWFMSGVEKWFGDKPDTWLAPVLAIILFIVSASVTASLVLLKPILLFLEGQKKEAFQMFVFTLGFLVVLLILGFFSLI